MGEKYYMITESRLKELLKQEAELEVLEADGVDNWSWYMEGARDYLKEYDCEDFFEVAEIRLKNYQRIL